MSNMPSIRMLKTQTLQLTNGQQKLVECDKNYRVVKLLTQENSCTYDIYFTDMECAKNIQSNMFEAKNARIIVMPISVPVVNINELSEESTLLLDKEFKDGSSYEDKVEVGKNVSSDAG